MRHPRRRLPDRTCRHGWTASRGTTDLRFKNVVITNGELFVNPATSVPVLGAVDGAGQYCANGNQVKTTSATAPVPSGILFDGVTIQNYRRDPSSSDHVDYLLPLLRHAYYSVQLGGGHGEDFHNVTVRNNSSDKDMTVGTSNSVANVAF